MGYRASTVTFDVLIKPSTLSMVFDYILVNDHLVIDHGHHTKARPGQPLYCPGRRLTEQTMR